MCVWLINPRAHAQRRVTVVVEYMSVCARLILETAIRTILKTINTRQYLLYMVDMDQPQCQYYRVDKHAVQNVDSASSSLSIALVILLLS